MLFSFTILFFNCTTEGNKNKHRKSLNSLQSSQEFRSFVLNAENGDIIFRNGLDEVSQAARSFNTRDKSFSHCGIVIKEEGLTYVYHSIGGSENPSGKLQKISINDFCNIETNNSFALYRLNQINTINDQLNKVVRNHYRNELKFDQYFNIKSDDAMYCSEFVAKSINEAFRNSKLETTFIETLGLGVTIDDIFLNENCELVKKIIF